MMYGEISKVRITLRLILLYRQVVSGESLKWLVLFAFTCVAAQAMILGAEDVYVKKGSTISLTCSVNVHSSPPGSVVWYQGNTIVDFESSRGGISLETEKTEAGTTSKLLVTKASLADSGNYTCLPSNANPASVFVHVLNGEPRSVRSWTRIL